VKTPSIEPTAIGEKILLDVIGEIPSSLPATDIKAAVMSRINPTEVDLVTALAMTASQRNMEKVKLWVQLNPG